MTLPTERYNSLKRCETLLVELCNPQKTPKIPKYIRIQARDALRHFPTSQDIDQIAEQSPDIISKT